MQKYFHMIERRLWPDFDLFTLPRFKSVEVYGVSDGRLDIQPIDLTGDKTLKNHIVSLILFYSNYRKTSIARASIARSS